MTAGPCVTPSTLDTRGSCELTMRAVLRDYKSTHKIIHATLHYDNMLLLLHCWEDVIVSDKTLMITQSADI